MGKEEEILFNLLRAGLWEKATDLSDLFPISGDTWRAVFDMARCQTVTGLVYSGLQQLPSSQLPPEPMMLRWVAEADRIERANEQANHTCAQLCCHLAAQGLHPVIVKGQVIAQTYASPLLREPGDIDLCFSDAAEFAAAQTVATQLGCRPERQPDGSLSYTYQGIEIEHHRRLIDIYSPCAVARLRPLLSPLQPVEVSLGSSTDSAVMAPHPMLHLLVLNAHICKHAIGRGVGLRQLCDIARAYHRWHPLIDGDALQTLYRRAGLTSWSRMLHTFLVRHLALPATALPYPDRQVSSEPLLRIVVRGGNFGQHRPGHPVAHTTTRRKIGTALSFVRQLGFSCRYAPAESLWMTLQLAKGNTIG